MKSAKTDSRRARAVRLSSLTIAFPMLAMSSAHADVVWAPASRWQPLPVNMLLGGMDGDGPNEGAPLFVCRAIFANSVHPGKLVGQNCNISYGGREYEIVNYEVATTDYGAWGPPNRSYAGALVGGYEPEQTLYVCRARYAEPARGGYRDRGVHPGKVVAGQCHFGWGGREILSSDFEVFYPDAPSRDEPGRKRGRRSDRDR